MRHSWHQRHGWAECLQCGVHVRSDRLYGNVYRRMLKPVGAREWHAIKRMPPCEAIVTSFQLRVRTYLDSVKTT